MYLSIIKISKQEGTTYTQWVGGFHKFCFVVLDEVQKFNKHWSNSDVANIILCQISVMPGNLNI